ncbi:hypothetical protein H109_00429 [Trichophyton interdigitale MR816]|uniref:Uncharacterized protein n=1 Tax=Trichophyton interdigitale (strain MR816) TaxID=1215338 RepID=A0A059JJY6_TRIIM|nr:hypothetical protein H109_00429 [Trichophyton interdigitale MR816]
MAEGQAVYICEQIKGETPSKYPANLKPESRTKFASTEPSHSIKQEVEALLYFDKVGCTATPKLFYIQQSVQQHDLVPGSCMILIITEKVPGTSLSQFWSYDLAKCENLRCFLELLTPYGCAGDPHLEKVVYDEQNNRW